MSSVSYWSYKKKKWCFRIIYRYIYIYMHVYIYTCVCIIHTCIHTYIVSAVPQLHCMGSRRTRFSDFCVVRQQVFPKGQFLLYPISELASSTPQCLHYHTLLSHARMCPSGQDNGRNILGSPSYSGRGSCNVSIHQSKFTVYYATYVT